jgi:ABC-type multidrug transport system fused ATPase/permease subunit
MIFDGTLRSNILYGLEFNGERMSDDEIWEMIRPVRADFGSRLEKGLDTEVGENGLKLSGGQAQRVMIAAAVIRKPRLLVLDEATSSLDSTTTREVQEGFKSILKPDVTALIISHNLSTIRPLVDQIIVLRPSDDVPPGASQIEAIARNFEEAYRISPTFRRLADDQDVVIKAKAA